jgi:hypothetical protein
MKGSNKEKNGGGNNWQEEIKINSFLIERKGLKEIGQYSQSYNKTFFSINV